MGRKRGVGRGWPKTSLAGRSRHAAEEGLFSKSGTDPVTECNTSYMTRGGHSTGSLHLLLCTMKAVVPTAQGFEGSTELLGGCVFCGTGDLGSSMFWWPQDTLAWKRTCGVFLQFSGTMDHREM